MSRLFIDIETIPTQDAAEIERIAAAERARNAELVKPHPEAKVLANIDEAVRKTALDGATGEVVCVAVSTGGGVVDCVWKRDYRVAGSERAMLVEVLRFIADREPLSICGHNVVGFDAPFLRHRGFVHGLTVPPSIYRSPKPWDAVADDTMLLWSGGQPGKSISLDRLCRALGVEGKGELDGAGVWDAVQAGRIDEVANYCADDVRRAYECHRRMAWSFDLEAGARVTEANLKAVREADLQAAARVKAKAEVAA